MAAGCLLRDRLEELWLHIDQLHLTYLEADESPRKLDEKKRLEGNLIIELNFTVDRSANICLLKLFIFFM